MKFTLHRKTNYIEFISGLNTNATNRGERYIAMKDRHGKWLIYDDVTDKAYNCPLASLRVLIEEGRLIEQAEAIFPIMQRIKFDL